MIRKSLRQITSMIPGAFVEDKWADIAIEGACKDTRSLLPHSLYIPLIGERFDGHEFAADAVRLGAAAALWQRDRGESPAGIPVVLVDDTLDALQKLASAYRRELPVKVIGVTGSNGKTSTKDMISAVLGSTRRVHKTIGNLNNHIGLPMTILEMDEQSEFAVLEMGMSGRGEIELLSRIAEPDCAVITNVGEAHMMQLGSREGIAEAKFEIVSGLKRGGTLIIPGDEPLLRKLADAHRKESPTRIIWFGLSGGNDYVADRIKVSIDYTEFAVVRTFGSGQIDRLRIPLLGRHNAVNALCAVAAAELFGVEEDDLRDSLRGMTPTGMRIEAVQTAGGATLLNDAYNASPASMNAALRLLEELAVEGRKIAVLGDMLELGEQSVSFHQEIGRNVSPDWLDYLFTYGELAAYIAKECADRFNPDQVESYTGKDKLIDRLRRHIEPADVVLVKASRGMKLEEVAEALRQN